MKAVYKSRLQRGMIKIINTIITDQVKTGLVKELERFAIRLTGILNSSIS